MIDGPNLSLHRIGLIACRLACFPAHRLHYPPSTYLRNRCDVLVVGSELWAAPSGSTDAHSRNQLLAACLESLDRSLYGVRSTLLRTYIIVPTVVVPTSQDFGAGRYAREEEWPVADQEGRERDSAILVRELKAAQAVKRSRAA